MGLKYGSQILVSYSYRPEKYYTLRKKSVNTPLELKPTPNKLKLKSKKHSTIDISVRVCQVD